MSNSAAKICAQKIVKQYSIFAGNDLARIAAEDDIEKIIVENFRKRQASDSDHARVISQWMNEWRQFFGGQYALAPKDAKAVKALLSIGDNTPERVIMTATAAWRFRDSRRHFNCKFSTTIAGLHSKWNEIRAELSTNATPVSDNQRNRSTY